MAIRERSVEDYLANRVKAMGGCCEKVRVIGQRGWPDRFCALPGGIVFLVELKRPIGGRLAAHQEKYHRELRALGVAVYTAKDSAQIDQLLSCVVKTRGPRRGKRRGPRMSIFPRSRKK